MPVDVGRVEGTQRSDLEEHAVMDDGFDAVADDNTMT